jgi:multiple sugar transport system substrate-binding protein
VTGPWNLGEFARRLPPDLAGAAHGAVPAPARDVPAVSVAGGASLVVSRGTSDPALARAFVQYLSEPATQCRLYALAGDLPARRSAWSACKIGDDPRAAAFLRQLQAVIATPKVPEWERIATRLTHYLELAVRGDLELDAALAALDHDVDAILEKRRWLRREAS